jgi:hypothetical protein
LHEPVLEPGEIREHEIHVRGGKAKRGKRIRGAVRFHAEHYYDGWGSDVVTAKLNLR